MNSYDIHLRIAARPRLLRCVRELVRAYLADCGFGEDQACAVVLAVDEACTNAIRHSYGGPCDQPLELLLRFGVEGLEVVVADCGAPLPPERAVPPEASAPDPEELRPGGLGLKLIHQVFDEVVFKRGPQGGNRIILRLKTHAPREEKGREDHGC